jgi:hypothetical protein
MPVTFRVDRGCGVLELQGAYTVAEARTTLLEGLASLPTGRATGLVVDVSDSDMVRARTSPDIMRAAQAMGELGERFAYRLGIVAPSALTFGLMRMGGSHAEGAGLMVRVCRSYATASAWVLGEGGADEKG